MKGITMSNQPRVHRPVTHGETVLRRSILAHQPRALESFLKMYGILWSHGVLDHATKELARIRDARVTNCVYCENLRFDVARNEGLSEADLDCVHDNYARSSLCERDKAALAYTDTFLADPSSLSDTLRAEMLKLFSAEEIVELTATLAISMGFSKMAVALGQEPDNMPVQVVPTPDWPDHP